VDIRYTTGKPRTVTLTAAEKRSIRMVFGLLQEISVHLEGEVYADSSGTATAILAAGFEEFADRYTPAPEPPEKGKKGEAKG